MLKSMTGYGIISHETPTQTITVEIKSINSKTQDFSIRIPKAWIDKEIEIKNKLSKELDRGKVIVNIDIVKKSDAPLTNLKINATLFSAYVHEIRSVTQPLGVSEQDILRFVLSQPDVIENGSIVTQDQSEWKSINYAIDEALNACNAFRIREGAILAQMLLQYIQKIRLDLKVLQQLDPERIKKVKERLQQKLEEYLPKDKIDQSRFEQEILYYIEKMDIEEEKVRLLAHLDYFETTLHQGDSVGKKLGFIAQEIGREINTIGSKCNDSTIQRLVVGMKEELEKIKEQSLNVL